MPGSLLAIAFLLQMAVFLFVGLAFVTLAESTPAESDALWLFGGLLAVYCVAAQAIVIGLIKRRSWARTAGIVLFGFAALSSGGELLVWFVSNLADWPWIARNLYRPLDCLWLAISIVGIRLLNRSSVLDWFDLDIDLTPETLPVDPIPHRRPTQIVGLDCVACGNRIAAEFEAEFCSECGAAVHSACRETFAGRCRKCSHVEGHSEPSVPKPRPKWLRQDRPLINRTLFGCICIGCGEVINDERGAAFCATCGNPVHDSCSRTPSGDACKACGYRPFV